MTRAIAVVGMGIVVPGASSPEEFWDVLSGDRDFFGEPDHFSLDHWHSPDEKVEDKSYIRAAGYLRTLTPDMALLLRHCLSQALDGVKRADTDRVGVHVALPPGNLALEEATLVAVGGATTRYPHAAPQPRQAFADRVVRAACAGLLPDDSEFQVVDSACGSSLYAIDLAAKALLSGERDVVVCGGANTGSRRDLVLFSKAMGFSRTGQVRAFDADADGVLFSDGAAVITLKRLERALDDGDEVLALLGGFGASVDGTGSVVAPDPEGQKLAVLRARAVNAVDPHAVDWIVGHGTGSRVGDTSELEGLASLSDSAPHLITSNKPLVGHAAWAAGAVSVVHAVLALRHERIPGERYFSCLPDGVRMDRMSVPTTDTPWPRTAGRIRTVGICAYGLGGGNAHLILHGPEAATTGPAGARVGEAPDPIVLVGWQAHLPAEPGEQQVLDWLAGRGSAPARTFGEVYPLPPFRLLRMPPVSARSVDRTHLMALSATARFVEEHSELWAPYRATTGVFTGHMGPTRAMTEYTVRVGADDLLAGAETGRLRERIDELKDRLPAANDMSMPGQLANMISCQLANRYHLHGMALALDAGRSSTQAALRTACRYLASEELDMALVVGASGHSGTLAEALTGSRAIAEGAVLLVLTRESVAREHGWTSLARITTEANGHAPSNVVGPDYQGAEGAFEVLRAVYSRLPATAVRNADPGPRVVVIPSKNPTQVTRSVIAYRRRDVIPAGHAALGQGALVLVDCADTAREVAPLLSAAGARIMCADALPADITAAADAKRDVLVVASARRPECAWPAPPPENLLRLQECLLHAVRAAGLDSVAAVLLDPLRGHTTHPHLTLITGFLRSLSHELPGAVYAVVTDAALDVALGQAAAERYAQRDHTVVQYRQGLRYVEVTCRAPLPDAPPTLESDYVVVATGGARGATAVAVTALARRTRARIWLLGTTPADNEVLHAPETRRDYIRRQHTAHPDVSVRELNRRFDAVLRPGEIQATLRELRTVCGADNVHYLVCDVRDRDQVLAAARQVYAHEGRVDLMIHGAGQIRSAPVGTKTVDDFRAVRDTKVAGYHHLKEAFADPPPRRWCTFGSLSGLTGFPGDTDYSSANEYLQAAARAEHAAGHDEVAIGWGLWRDAGMVKELADGISRQHALAGMSNAEGAAAFLATLATPGDPTPVLGLPHEPAFTTPAGLLDGSWSWRPDPLRDTYLAEHLIDGRPLLPAAIMLALAAEAALQRVPGTEVAGFRDLVIEEPLYTEPKGAEVTCHIRAAVAGPDRVTVELRSDLVSRTGHALRRDRPHCRVDVVLGTRPSPPVERASDPLPPLAECPTARPDSSVQLSGVWRTNLRPAASLDGAEALWLPRLEPDGPFARLAVPALLIDATARLFRYPPGPDGEHVMGVPTGIARIDLFTSATDTELATRHPEGLRLRFRSTEDRAVAATHDGVVQLAVIGLRMHVTDRFPATVHYREWRP